MRDFDDDLFLLDDGSKIAVVGGGPAGTFFAYFAMDFADRLGMDIEIDIYEAKDFKCAGPKGCNNCGGIVSESLIQTSDFWVTNIRLTKGFPDGLTLYGGIDNVLDYVQGGGCTGEQAAANPALVGCLGDPRYDTNWGPLRGRYYYVGLGYNFDKGS